MSTSTVASAANDRQVGGRHYKTGSIEHWDLMHDCDVPYLLGCASKYVARHSNKAGREDLEKAIHYCEKYAEKVGPGTTVRDWRVATGDLLDWAAEAGIMSRELRILHCMLVYKKMDQTIALIRARIEECYSADQYKGNDPELRATIEALRPGTPEDGGHHARQPPDEEGEAIKHWTYNDIRAMRLPPSLSEHEWQHRCNQDVQGLYHYDVSAARYLINDESREATHHCTARD